MKSVLTLLLSLSTVLGAPLDARAADNLDVDNVLSAKTIKANAAGSIQLTTRFSGATAPDAPKIAVVVSELTAFDGPAPAQGSIKSYRVWTDPQTGAQAFSSVITFDGDAFGKVYIVVSRWYDDAGKLLGTQSQAVPVQRRGPPPVALDVLNTPNAYGDVLVERGDFVQVNYIVGCDFEWLDDDCAAQQAESAHKDRIQLVQTSSGEIVDETRRGRRLSGLVLLKAKGKTTGALTVGYVSAGDDATWGVSGASILAVADLVMGELLGRTRQLEAQVAELSDELAVARAQVAANTELAMRNGELLIDHELTHVKQQAGIQKLETGLATAGGAIAANTEAIKRNSDTLIGHELTHVKQQASISKLESGVASNTETTATLNDRVAANEGAIAEHDKKLNFPSSGLGSPLGNYEGILRSSQFIVGDDQPARLIFPFLEDFSVQSGSGVVNGDDPTLKRYAYLSEVTLVDETEGDESVIGIYSRSSVGGLVISDPQIVMANLKKKDPGATVFIKDYDADDDGHWSGRMIGTGTVSADGSVILSDPGIEDLFLD